MDRILRTDLDTLVSPRQGPCVSLFMPLHPAGRDGKEDGIRLRTLTDEAKQALITRGMRRSEAEYLVAPARALPTDEIAWQHRGRSLAAFLAPGFHRVFHLDGEIESAIHVGDEFCLRPLLPLVGEEDRFFVLALSQNATHLYEGNATELHEIPVIGLPKNLEEAVQLEDTQRGEQAHSAMRGNLGKQGAVFHGQGGKADAIEADLREYVRMVAAAIDRHLRNEQAPLLLATVAANVPLWCEFSCYEHLQQGFVVGNPDHLSPAQMHAKAWPIVEPALARREALQRRRLDEADGSKVSFGLENIVPAAFRGRIDTLFIDCTQQRFGRYHPEDESVELHSQPEPGDQDLVELAAMQTLKHAGDVFPLHEGDGASQESAEALLRF